jgi:hypothetical protein
LSSHLCSHLCSHLSTHICSQPHPPLREAIMAALFEPTWYNVALLAYFGLSAVPMFFGQSKVNLYHHYYAKPSKPTDLTEHTHCNEKPNKATNSPT